MENIDDILNMDLTNVDIERPILAPGSGTLRLVKAEQRDTQSGGKKITFQFVTEENQKDTKDNVVHAGFGMYYDLVLTTNQDDPTKLENFKRMRAEKMKQLAVAFGVETLGQPQDHEGKKVHARWKVREYNGAESNEITRFSVAQ